MVQADKSVACFREEVADAPVIKARQLLRNVLSNVPARGETWPPLCHTVIEWLDLASIVSHSD